MAFVGGLIGTKVQRDEDEVIRGAGSVMVTGVFLFGRDHSRQAKVLDERQV